jgi:hypothetical protein
MTVPRDPPISGTADLTQTRQPNRPAHHSPTLARVDQHLGNGEVGTRHTGVGTDPLQGALALFGGDTERIEIGRLIRHRAIQPANVPLHPCRTGRAEGAVTVEQQHRRRHTHLITVPITG